MPGTLNVLYRASPMAQRQRIRLQGRRLGFDPWAGKIPWRRKGNPLQYSFLENPRDRGAWRATVHGVTELDTTEGLTVHFTSGPVVNTETSPVNNFGATKDLLIHLWSIIHQGIG